MKRLSLLMAALLLFSLVLSAQETQDLVKALQGSPDSKAYPNAQTLILWEKSDVEVRESGLSLVTRESFTKVLTDQGAQELKALLYGYDPLSAFVEVKEAQIVRKSGTVEKVDLSRLADYIAPARMIYWNAREKILPIGRLEPGDAVWVKSFQKGFTYALLHQDNDLDEARYAPPMKGHFYDIVPFYGPAPILRKSYKISLPSTKLLQYQFYNGEAEVSVRREGDKMVYLWEKQNLLPCPLEAAMVDLSDVAPKLLLSTSPDWKAKSLWFHKVNEDFGSFEADDNIRAKVSEIIKGSKDDSEKISRLTHWVAENIRYSGLNMGTGEGYTLHKGTMIFRDRSGVCKDKAGMLITMLRAAGFESYPAMTMAGSRIETVPADQFNHCVTLVKTAKGYQLLDPTWVPGVRELWSSAEQQQEYLMGVPEGADLATTPVSPAENHYLRYKVRSRLLPDGTLQGALSIEGEGQSDSSLRRFLSRGLRLNWRNGLESQLLSLYPSMKILSISYQDPEDISLPIRFRLEFSIPDYAQFQEKRAFLKPFSSQLPFSGAFNAERFNLGPEIRKYPFKVRSSQLLEVDEEMELPQGYTLEERSRDGKVESANLRFSQSFSQKGKLLKIAKSYRLGLRIWPSEEWPSFRKALQEYKKANETLWILNKGGRS